MQPLLAYDLYGVTAKVLTLAGTSLSANLPRSCPLPLWTLGIVCCCGSDFLVHRLSLTWCECFYPVRVCWVGLVEQVFLFAKLLSQQLLPQLANNMLSSTIQVLAL